MRYTKKKVDGYKSSLNAYLSICALLNQHLDLVYKPNASISPMSSRQSLCCLQPGIVTNISKFLAIFCCSTVVARILLALWLLSTGSSNTIFSPSPSLKPSSGTNSHSRDNSPSPSDLINAAAVKCSSAFCYTLSGGVKILRLSTFKIETIPSTNRGSVVISKAYR